MIDNVPVGFMLSGPSNFAKVDLPQVCCDISDGDAQDLMMVKATASPAPTEPTEAPAPVASNSNEKRIRVCCLT